MIIESILTLHQVKKKYGTIAAVNGISFDVFQGEVFGLLGPNGAGKTTTINIIAGLIKPDQGQVLFKGNNILEEKDFGKRIGICPQENVHWKKLTPREQLKFLGQMYGMAPALIDRRIEVLIDDLDLGGSADRLAGRLSGGMKRRLNIALALVHDPEILILDEPETGLDPQSRIGMREYVRSLAREKSIILTTHNMDEAHRMADRVAVVDRGKLLVIDTPQALVKGVGDGDVLEIDLVDFPVDADILNLPPETSHFVVGDMIQIRGLDLVNFMPEILANIEKAGIQPGEIRLRKNTLEDVFIQLTGRRLRD
jgi:ABC-2 type transport system ATP-binding protein